MYPIPLQAIAPLLLALAPLVLLIAFCVTRHVDVPFWDQWSLAPRLDRLAAGTLRLRDVWAQHGEHRPMIPILVMLGLARMTAWNIGYEIAVNVTLGFLTFLVFLRYVATAWRGHGGAPWWLLPWCAALLFSPVQWENWLWGWQMTALMGSCAATTGLYLLAVHERRWAFMAALACGVWAIYSFGAGLVYWFCGPAVIWFATPARRARRARRIALWAVAAVVVFATYFYDYQRPNQPSPLAAFSSLTAFAGWLRYTFAFLGSPVGWYDHALPIGLGIGGTLVLGALIVHLRRWHGESAFRFPCALGVHAIGVAALSGLGRGWMGVEQALSSRYTTFGMPFWIAIAALVVFAWRIQPAPRRLAAQIVGVAVLVALLVPIGASAKEGVRIATGRAETLRFARRGLIVGRSQALMAMVYPNVEDVKTYRTMLHRLHLSVFRTSPSTTYPVPAEP